MVAIGDQWVTPECKDAFVQFLQEGGSPDGLAKLKAPQYASTEIRLTPLLAQTWKIFGDHAGLLIGAAVIGGIVQLVLVHILREFQLTFYMSNKHITGPWLLVGFLATLSGVMVRSIYVSIMQRHVWLLLNAQRGTTEYLLREAFRHWAKVMWARIALGASMIGGWLLLVVFCPIFGTRYWLAPCSAIIHPDQAPMQASARAVRGSAWRVFSFVSVVRLATGLPFIIWHQLPQWAAVYMAPVSHWSRTHLPHLRAVWPRSLVTDIAISLPLVFAVVFDVVLYRALTDKAGPAASDNAVANASEPVA